MTRSIVKLPSRPAEVGSSSPGDAVPAAEAPDGSGVSITTPVGAAALLICASIVSATLIWSYWPILGEMAGRWQRDPRYSHGFLVPFFACYLFWLRRPEQPTASPSNAVAFCLLAAAAGLKLLGGFFFVSWLEAISFLVAIAGLCCLLGGKPVLRWAGPSIAFVMFMVPLPYTLEAALGGPLQRFASEASSCVLQVFGVPAFSSGNTIIIDDFQLGIIDACNGIGMSYMFLACSCGAALLASRPLVESAILIASAIPFGLAANIARIVATALLYRTAGQSLADAVYHDLAGWLMMLLALLFLWLECKLLPHLFIEESIESPLPPMPSEESRSSQEAVLASWPRPRVAPTLVAVSILIATGAVTGRWTHRWMISDELNSAVVRLDSVPLTFGDWVAHDERVDPRSLAAADLEGGVMRRYQNRRNGRKIHVMLVCGRPGPVAVHTPDICYPATGYQMAQTEPSKVVLGGPRPDPSESQFLVARFTRDRSLNCEGLQVYWSWNASGKWTVPRSPRVEFAGQPFLYKVYVVSTGTSEDEKTGAAWEMEFIRQLASELDKALFSGQSKRSETGSAAAASFDRSSLHARGARSALTSLVTHDLAP
jgi:exosortase